MRDIRKWIKEQTTKWKRKLFIQLLNLPLESKQTSKHRSIRSMRSLMVTWGTPFKLRSLHLHSLSFSKVCDGSTEVVCSATHVQWIPHVFHGRDIGPGYLPEKHIDFMYLFESPSATCDREFFCWSRAACTSDNYNLKNLVDVPLRFQTMGDVEGKMHNVRTWCFWKSFSPIWGWNDAQRYGLESEVNLKIATAIWDWSFTSKRGICLSPIPDFNSLSSCYSYDSKPDVQLYVERLT